MLIVLVEHNFRFLTSVATAVVVLDFGRKIFEGTPSAAIADTTVIAAFTGAKPAAAARDERETVSDRA
jgi:branched-chain amino acid transport system ATP-binding protein